MRVVHSLRTVATDPERHRQRSDFAFAELDSKEGGLQSWPRTSVSNAAGFEAPWEMPCRLADDALRQSMLFWFSFARRQLSFYGFIP